ncbi:MAG TPA: DUF4340 domain-containing protein [Burkholderiales bacterium]|nr:DUF4340 domain-containing protein [Burkholderiales bacterium]
MNRKQFLILVVALVVLGGAGLALFWQDIAAYRAAGAKIGARLLPDLKVSEVEQIRLQDAKSQATLVKKGNAWVVRERGDYPADVQKIGDLLIKLAELKVTQSESVGESLLPRLDLAQPGKGEGGGTLVEFKGAADKTLASLILGKTVLKKDPVNPLPGAQNGVPAGRYVLVAGARDTVVVVSDPLSGAEAGPAQWLLKDFFKADRIRTLTVGEGAAQWKITRDEEYGQWKFASGSGTLDASAAVGAANALSGLAFDDVVTGSREGETEHPGTVTAETFDNLTYTLKVARRKAGGDYDVSFAVSGEPPAKRVPEKNEKPEDKARLDKEFAETLKKLEERIAREKALAKWTYVVSAKQLAPLMKERAQMIAARPKK